MAGGGSGGSIEYKEYFDSLASTLVEFPPYSRMPPLSSFQETTIRGPPLSQLEQHTVAKERCAGFVHVKDQTCVCHCKYRSGEGTR
jgi:hypothetical protein